MKLSMFFEFPGILILIGVALLIASLVIGIIAFKKDDNNELNKEEIREEKPITIIDDNYDEETKEEESEIKEIKKNLIYNGKKPKDNTKFDINSENNIGKIEDKQEEEEDIELL